MIQAIFQSRQNRLLLSLLIGLVVGGICTAYHIKFERGSGDLAWPLCGARVLLAGGEPYTECIPRSRTVPVIGTTNPLTTVLILIPFTPFPEPIVAGLVLGLSTTLLTWALLDTSAPWSLLALLSASFWWSIATAQWSPLMLAVALLPSLYPLTMIKPQLGLPIALLRFTRYRALTCIVILVLTLVIDPFWFVKWLTHIDPYDRAIPLLVLPLGPLLLLAGLRWRDTRAHWLLLYALMPQRFMYDQLLLFLIPRSRQEMLVLVGLSWIAFFCWFVVAGPAMPWAVILLYIPCLLIVLREPIQASLLSRMKLPWPGRHNG